MQKNNLLIIGSVVGISAIISTAVLASPPGPPPTPNNPDASFNSVNIPNSNQANGLYVKNATGVAVNAETTSGSAGVIGKSNGNGIGVSGISATGVGLYGQSTDVNGQAIYAYNSKGSGIIGVTNANPVYGVAGVQGLGNLYGVSGIAYAGTGGSFSGSTGARAAVSAGTVDGDGLVAIGKGTGEGVFAYNNDDSGSAKGIYAFANGIGGTGGYFEGTAYGVNARATNATGAAGRFVSSDGFKSVILGNSTNAIQANGNSVVSGKQIVGDTAVPTHTLTIKSTDNNTLRLRGPTGGFEYGSKMNLGDGDYVYLQEDTDDHLTEYGGAGVKINGGSGTIDLLNTITNSGTNNGGDLYFSDHVRSSGGFGSVYTKSSSSVSSIPGSFSVWSTYSMPSLSCNGANDVMLSCSLSDSNNSSIVTSNSNILGKTCWVYVHNLSSSAYCGNASSCPSPYPITVKGVCWDPNG